MADKAIIQHYYKKGYAAYKIWNEKPDRDWLYGHERKIWIVQGPLHAVKMKIRLKK